MKGKFLAGVALGAFFLYLSLKNVDLRETGRTLASVKYAWFLVMLVLNALVLWLRAVRWRILLLPVKPVPSMRLLSPMCIGFMANFIFPARAGEFIRAYLVGKKEGISKSSAFATVVVERLFDGLAIISFLAVAPFFFQNIEGTMAKKLQWAGLGVFFFYVSVLAVLLVLSHHRERLDAFLSKSSLVHRWKIVGKLFELIQKFTDGLAVLKSTGEVVQALVLSLLIWSFAAGINLAMMYSIDIHLPLYAAFFLVVIQSFGVMVPSPGFVGSYQYAHIFALSIYGISETRSLSLAILIHAGYFITFVGLGLFFLGREHLSFKELGKASEEKTE